MSRVVYLEVLIDETQNYFMAEILPPGGKQYESLIMTVDMVMPTTPPNDILFTAYFPQIDTVEAGDVFKARYDGDAEFKVRLDSTIAMAYSNLVKIRHPVKPSLPGFAGGTNRIQ